MIGKDTSCAGCGTPMRSCVLPAFCSTECRNAKKARRQALEAKIVAEHADRPAVVQKCDPADVYRVGQIIDLE